MRITSLTPLVVGAGMRHRVFVGIASEDGLTGWGEATLEWKIRSVVSAITGIDQAVHDLQGAGARRPDLRALRGTLP